MRAALLLALPLPALAASTPPAVASATGIWGVLQVVFSLALVLAVIVGCAWLFRRMSGRMPGGGARHLRVVSASMIGQRERVVIVEVGEEWLVLGVTSHTVNLLTRQARPEQEPPAALAGPVQESFARWLKQAINKQRKQ